MSNCNSCDLTSKDNTTDVLIMQLKREVKELANSTNATLLLQNGKIAETCTYIKNNLSNYLRDMFDVMEANGDLDEIISSSLLEQSLYVMPEDFGAVGDGITDDTIAIQSAIDSAYCNNKKIIFAKNKTYVVNSSNEWIILKPNTSIDLNDSTIDCKNNHLFGNFTQNYNFTNYEGYGNIEIFNGTILHGGLSFIQSHDVYIHDIKFMNCDNDHWFEISGCKDFKIFNCEFEGMTEATAGREYVEYIQIDGNNYAAFPWLPTTDAAFQNLGNKNITVAYCSFKKGNGEYNYLYCAVGGHSSNAIKHENINISNNKIENPIYNIAIRMFSCKNSSVMNNTIVSDAANKFLCQARECERVVISGNVILNEIGRLCAIVNSSYLKIEGNSTNRFKNNMSTITIDYNSDDPVFEKCDEYFPLIPISYTSGDITFNKKITLFNELTIFTGGFSLETFCVQTARAWIGFYFRLDDDLAVINTNGGFDTLSIDSADPLKGTWNSARQLRMIYARVI